MMNRLPERIRAKIEQVTESGCWLWTACLDQYGYGDSKLGKAHRLVYELLVGQIPAGMVMDHKCRVRCCVRPDHLRVVSKKVNAVENSLGPTAINAGKVRCKRGHPLVAGNLIPHDDGRRECATCKPELDRKWAEANRDKVNANQRRHYYRHLAERRETSRLENVKRAASGYYAKYWARRKAEAAAGGRPLRRER